MLSVLLGCTGHPPPCSVSVEDRPEPRWVLVDGLPPHRVMVAGGSRPVSGSVREGPDGAVFAPDFPLTPGLTYTAESAGCAAVFTVPDVVPVAPHVVKVFPTAPEIPENVLRFYVMFSQPMAEGQFLSHIRLERVDTGEDLTGVFFDNIHELWSSDRKRITLLVDPGRVKTGLVAHRQLGRAFEAGGHYRLHVLPTWSSMRGAKLASAYVHEFRAIDEDRQRVDPGTWRLALPPSGSRSPLRIDFGEPVDHVSIHRLIRVLDPAGDPLSGGWSVGPEGRTAAWTPERSWGVPVEEHVLLVSGRFEDIAGNNLNAAMDHAVGDRPPGDEGRPVRRKLGSREVTGAASRSR